MKVNNSTNFVARLLYPGRRVEHLPNCPFVEPTVQTNNVFFAGRVPSKNPPSADLKRQEDVRLAARISLALHHPERLLRQ